MTNIQLQTKVHDRTIIKLGDSYAITLPKEQMEKAGFKLGMWVTVDLSFDMERDSEDLVDYSDDLAEARDYLKRFDSLSIDDLNELCGKMDWDGMDETKPLESEKESVLIELKAHEKWLKREVEDYDKILSSEISDDDFDYDKRGKETVGLED